MSVPVLIDELEIAVVGTGVMGAGIAQVAAVHGHSVFLLDAARSEGRSGLVRIRSGPQEARGLGRLRNRGSVLASVQTLLNPWYRFTQHINVDGTLEVY